jgi:hypothetical protein
LIPVPECPDGHNTWLDFWIRIELKTFESVNKSIEIVEQPT